MIFIMSFFFMTLTLQQNTFATESHFEFEEDFSLPIVYLNLVVDVGSVHDSAERLGVANVANQMLLRGTQKHSKKRFDELLENIGGKVDVHTDLESTVFSMAVLSENLNSFLELIIEALTLPKFDSEELAKVKKEVEGEILEKKGDNVELSHYHFLRFFYGNHPYGNPKLGTQKGLLQINHRDVLEYYSKYYGGLTLALFGTGAVKKNIVQLWYAMLTDKLTALHPEVKRPVRIDPLHMHTGREILLVNKSGATQAPVVIGGKGLRPETPGFWPIQLANFTFGGHSFHARMFRELREKRGWTYWAHSGFRFAKQPRHYSLNFAPKTEDTVAAIQTTLSLFEEFIKDGVTKEEFEFAKKSIVNNAPFNYDTSQKRLQNLTQEYVLGFPKGYYKNLAKNIEKVHYDEVLPALKAFYEPQSLKVVLVGDEKKLKESLTKLPGFQTFVVKSYLED